MEWFDAPWYIIDNAIDFMSKKPFCQVFHANLCFVAASPTSSSRVETVVMQLRQGIFEGRFPPGAPLRELTLARELSVSQATVREALQRLEHAGLVTRKPNIGATVTRLSPKDVKERVAL